MVFEREGDTDEEPGYNSWHAGPVPAVDPPASARDAAVQQAAEAADRARHRGLQEECGAPQPAPRRHDGPARSVQEAPLAVVGAHFRAAPPALRQTVPGAER